MIYYLLNYKNDGIFIQHYNMTIEKVCDNCHILYTVPHNIVMKTCAICNSKIKRSKQIVVVLVPDYEHPLYFNHGITLDGIRSALKVEGGYLTSTTKTLPNSGTIFVIMNLNSIIEQDVYKYIPPPVKRHCFTYWSEYLCLLCISTCVCTIIVPNRYIDGIVYKYPEYPQNSVQMTNTK